MQEPLGNDVFGEIGFLFSNLSSDVKTNIALLTKLLHKIDVFFLDDEIVELDDVGMLNCFHDRDLDRGGCTYLRACSSLVYNFLAIW